MEKIKTKRLSFLMPGAALQLTARGEQSGGPTCSGCSLQLATFFYSSHMKCGNSAATAIAAAHDLRKTIGGRSNQFQSIRQPVFPAAGGAHTQMGWMEVAL